MPRGSSALVLQPLSNWLQRFFTLLAVTATIAGVMIIIMVISSVAMRHIAHAPFRFTEELVGLLMTTAFFLALPLVTLKAEHVRVQIVVSSLPTHLRRPVAVAAAGFGIAFSLWYFWLCVPWLEFAYQRNIKTEVGRLLMYPWMAILPVSMLLTAIAFGVRAATDAQSDDER